MLKASLLYLLSAVSGVCVERCLAFNSLLKRILLIFSIGAAQLMISIQALSLLKRLTGPGLLAANIVLSVLVFGVLALKAKLVGRISWRTLAERALTELAACRRDPVIMALVGLSGLIFVTGCVAGRLMIPLGDPYHFEMPLFWMQNQSMLPFPVHDPRLVSLAFLSEALQLPGFLYARTPGMAVLLTLWAGVIGLWVVFSLARRTGAGLKASLCAAAITAGYTPFAMSPLTASAEILLAGSFFGGGLIFLADAYDQKSSPGLPSADLACSVFCFLMGCGAKNTTVLLAPLYLLFLGIVCFALLRRHRRPSPMVGSGSISIPEGQDATLPGSHWGLAVRKLGMPLALASLAGLLCSGLAWNYTSNQIWFGDARGPKPVRQTVSTNFHPRAIWTRFCRGAVLLAFDTIWIPNSARQPYATLCQKAIQTLGAQQRLTEDDNFYGFQPETLGPRKGLGLLGVILFTPALVLATRRCAALKKWQGTGTCSCRFTTLLLVAMTLGSFLACHAVLRWQSLGGVRLMPAFVIAGAPLTALILERRWVRSCALVLLMVSGFMFFILWVGNVARRLDWVECKPFRWIARLQKTHSMSIRYHWQNEPEREVSLREDYSYSEVFKTLLERLRQPCSIGFAAGMGRLDDINSECGVLFGGHFQNRVVPLVDCRSQDRVLDPPAELQYVVATDKFTEMKGWAEARGFQPLFEATGPRGEIVLAWEKRPPTTASTRSN